MAVNGISFLISFVLSAAVIKLLGFILNVLTKLPVINGINKIAGAAVGGIKCIIFIWIAFLVLTLLCNTTLGQQGMALIQQDAFLNFLYSQNVFVKVFMSVFYGNWAWNVKKCKKIKKIEKRGWRNRTPMIYWISLLRKRDFFLKRIEKVSKN